MRRVVRVRWYGEGPLHLALLAATFALAGYALARLLGGDADTPRIVVWFVGAALVHDLVLLPLYVSVDRAGRGALGPVSGPDAPGAGPGLVNFLRVPAFLSLLLLLVWFPLITRQSQRYEPTSGLSPGRFLGNWLLITAALFAVSALWLLVRGARLRRRARKGRPSASH